jgi:hypothetical protein
MPACWSSDGSSLAGRRGAPLFAEPKSDSGNDTVVELSQGTIGALMARRLTQDVGRQQWCDTYQDHDLMFARENGAPYEPTSVTRTLQGPSH